MAGHVVGPLVRRRAGELVYDATDGDGREQSIVVPVAPQARQDDRVLFRRVARLRAEIEHPAMLPVLDWGEHAGTRFLVTERYPLRTLADAVRGERLAPASAVALLSPVADALDRCHSRGLVHQNLGADSMLLDGEGIVLDGFGIATIGSVRNWDARGAAEFRYGSPDVMRGDPIAPATDVYSLTAVLVHLLTGRAPYADVALPPSNTAWAAALLHLAEPVPLPSHVNADLSPAIDEVVAWGMAKEPADRPLSATALLDAAAEALRVGPARKRGSQSRQAPRTRASTDVIPSPRSYGRARLARPRLAHVAVLLAAAVLGVGAAAAVDPVGGDSQGPSAADRDARLVAALDDRRGGLRYELAHASHPRDQAAAAHGLEDAYGTLAARGESPAMAAAARGAAAAYAGLSDSAEAGDEARYADASSGVDAAEARFAAAVANLRDARN